MIAETKDRPTTPLTAPFPVRVGTDADVVVLASSAPSGTNSPVKLLQNLNRKPYKLLVDDSSSLPIFRTKTLMTVQDLHPNVQGIRRVYENGPPSSSSETMYLVCHPDPSLNKDILLWDDILAVFSSALYVRSDATVIPFAKGPDFKKQVLFSLCLDPLRIVSVPGVALDVIVRDQLREKELPLDSLQQVLPRLIQGGQHVNHPGAPQEHSSTGPLDITETMMNARLGDKYAQNSLGEMYKDGRGVHQDYQTAMDWFPRPGTCTVQHGRFPLLKMIRRRNAPSEAYTSMAKARPKTIVKGLQGA
ncbi:MAG: hypothetical protein JOS17DRAFT_793643 [Linnemannia elongata]|nr:MAG: hypothetical protein JOS17DRAFT_793643 [Linnemannia elongata]